MAADIAAQQAQVQAMFGSDSDSEEDAVGVGVGTAPAAPAPSAAGVAGLLGDSDLEEDEAPAPTRLKLKSKGSRGKKRARQESPRRSGSDAAPAPSPAVAEGDEYDSEPDDGPTAEDDAFLDTAEDDAELLAEYSKQKQDFKDVRPEGEAPQRETQAEIVERVFSKKSKKRRKAETDDERHAAAREVILLMLESAEADKAARQRGMPQLHKLQVLDKVSSACRSKNIQSILLDGPREAGGNGGTTPLLVAMRDWLAPTLQRSADGTQRLRLPPARIRTECYELLDQLDLEPFHLRISHLGQVLLAFYKSPEETTQNRAKLKALIEKWQRPIFHKRATYKGSTNDLFKESIARSARAASAWKSARADSAAAALGAQATGMEAYAAAAKADALAPAFDLGAAINTGATEYGSKSKSYRAYVPQPANVRFRTVPKASIAADRRAAEEAVDAADRMAGVEEAMEVPTAGSGRKVSSANATNVARRRMVAKAKAAQRAGSFRANMSIEGRGL